MRPIHRHIIIFLSLFLPISVSAQDKTQVYTKYIDSIKQSTYPYVFPAWGKRVVKKGVDLPLSAGIMVNYFAGSQQMKISDLKVGFNDQPMVPLNFIQFGEVKAIFQSISTRVDLWALPFVNIYGIFGESFEKTKITITEPVSFSSEASFKGPTAGFGLTAGGRLKGIFFTLDYNNTWTFLAQIKGAVFTQAYTSRIGHLIAFKAHPDQNITLWAGASGIYIDRMTEGSIKISDLKTNAATGQLEQIVSRITTKDFKDATINYSLQKRATSHWSMLVGGQYQLNHHWQFRTEAGFLGGRSSILASANYRFGL